MRTKRREERNDVFSCFFLFGGSESQTLPPPRALPVPLAGALPKPCVEHGHAQRVRAFAARPRDAPAAICLGGESKAPPAGTLSRRHRAVTCAVRGGAGENHSRITSISRARFSPDPLSFPGCVRACRCCGGVCPVSAICSPPEGGLPRTSQAAPFGGGEAVRQDSGSAREGRRRRASAGLVLRPRRVAAECALWGAHAHSTPRAAQQRGRARERHGSGRDARRAAQRSRAK